MYKWFKLIVAWPVSWLLDYLGNFISNFSIFFINQKCQAFIYRVYNPVLLAGCNVQDWAAGKRPYFPWGEITMDEETIARLKQEDEKRQPAD